MDLAALRDMSDEGLVGEFVRTGSEGAFGELVGRHAGWVFAAAKRQLQDRHLAEDATQAVFVLLAQKAERMGRGIKVSGWLFNTLAYTVRNLRRTRARQERVQRRVVLERATVVGAMSERERAVVEEMVGQLDGAVGMLGQEDRSAVVLRFYQGLAFEDVAKHLGVNETAARKRVERAVGKLRRRMGAGVTADTMTTASGEGRPEGGGLEQTVCATALAAKAGAAIPATVAAAVKGTGWLMAMAKIKKAGVATAGVAAGVVIVLVMLHGLGGKGERGAPVEAGERGGEGTERAGGAATMPVAVANPDAAAAAPVVHGTREFERVVDEKGVLTVYRTMLPDAPWGGEWSRAEVKETVKGNRPYLGDFTPGAPVTLKLGGFPEHKLVRISFDLYLLRSWDGSQPQHGWGLWDLSLGDGRNLVHTTFSNVGFFGGNNEQSFPDQFPGRPFPAWTGAVENQTLGYYQQVGKPDPTIYDTSSVYHFELAVPHTGEDVEFQFKSEMRKDQRKYFGLANVKVDLLPTLATHTEKEYAALWTDLANGDGMKAYKARWEMIAAGDEAVAFIRKHLEEKVAVSKEELVKKVGAFEDPAKAREAFWDVVVHGRDAEAALGAPVSFGGFSEAGRFLECAHNVVTFYPATATETRLERVKHILGAIGSEEAKQAAGGIGEHVVMTEGREYMVWPWQTARKEVEAGAVPARVPPPR